MKRIAIVALLLCSSAGWADGIRTTEQQVFTTQKTATHSVIVKDIGQASHWLNYCTTGTAPLAISIQLEASNNAHLADGSDGDWFVITPASTLVRSCSAGGNVTLEAGARWHAVRANLTVFTAADGTSALNAWYSASASPLSLAQSYVALSTILNGAPPTIVQSVTAGAVQTQLDTGSSTYVNALASSAANEKLAVNAKAMIVEKGSRWSVTSNPAAGSQATISKAAGAGTVIHVADCVTFSAGSVAAPALTALTINLRDGATGAGTLLHTWQVVIPNSTGQNVAPVSFCGLNIAGSTTTAMTLEFSASLANLIESVSLSGYDTN